MEDQGQRAGCSVRGGHHPLWKVCGVQLTPARLLCRVTPLVSRGRHLAACSSHQLLPPSSVPVRTHTAPSITGQPRTPLAGVSGSRSQLPTCCHGEEPGLSTGGWGGEQVGQSPEAPTCHLCKQRLPGAPDGALKPSHVRASLPQPSRSPASHPESTAQWPRAVGTSPAGPGTLGRHYRLTRVRAHGASEATGETPAWRLTLASVNHSPASGLSPALN